MGESGRGWEGLCGRVVGGGVGGGGGKEEGGRGWKEKKKKEIGNRVFFLLSLLSHPPQTSHLTPPSPLFPHSPTLYPILLL